MEAAQLVLSSFKEIFNTKPDDVLLIGDEMPIPTFQQETLNQLLTEFVKSSLKQQILISINSPDLIVVGDIHGSLHDLLRIFLIHGLPPKTEYLFLGDYVDRGQYSVEVVSLLFAMQILYPDHVFLLRGNHEISAVNKIYGFYSEVKKLYDSEQLYVNFNSAFEFLPLCAVINSKYFCVHGGISPVFLDLQQLQKYSLPIHEIDEFINDLLWSDPTDHIKLFGPNERGSGCCWGRFATERFLKAHSFEAIIRAHQCVEKGIQLSHNKQVVTVFSASYYTPAGNSSGFLRITSNDVNIVVLPPLERKKRAMCSFFIVYSSTPLSIQEGNAKSGVLKTSFGPKAHTNIIRARMKPSIQFSQQSFRKSIVSSCRPILKSVSERPITNTP